MPFFKDKQFQEVHRLLKNGNYTVAIEMMDKWKPLHLALYQAHYIRDREILARSEFDSLWKLKRESFKLEQSPTFQFRQTDVKDADFVAGYTFYLLALHFKEQKATPKFEDALQNSIQFHSFHPLQLILNQLIIAPVTSVTEYCDNLALALHTMEARAVQFGTPGYLLLAKGYLQLALSAQGAGEEARQVAAFKIVLKNLQWAHLAENESVDHIHNAYFGVGLKLGNPFNIDTVESMLSYCRDLCVNILSLPEQNFVKMEAAREYQTRNGSSASAPVASL